MTKEECAEYLDSNPQDLEYILDNVLNRRDLTHVLVSKDDFEEVQKYAKERRILRRSYIANKSPAYNGVTSTKRTYSLAGFICNKAAVQIGDRVKLPAFTVPAVTMDGEEELFFGEKSINADEAIVISKDENGNFILIFDHCLFESAMDLNGEKRFEKTQLGQYLQSEFLRAMNGAGIPAESCGLISAEEMFGDNSLEYFKKGHNRIAFGFGEDYSCQYWLSTLYDEIAGAVNFCNVSFGGGSNYGLASCVGCFVRPRFVISAV